MIKIKAKKTKWGYRGYIESWEEDKLGVTRYKRAFKLWSEVAGPHRVTKEDALQDAEILKKYRDPIY